MKRILFALVAVLALLVTLAAPASAQDPSITIDPPSVEAPGEYDFTVTGADFAPTAGFVLPCAGAEGSLETIAAGDPAALCDLAALTPYSPADDGTWEVMVTYTIPEGGLIVAAGDAGGTNSSAALISIGAAEEAPAEEAPAEEAPAEEALAETGVESAMLLVIGAAVVMAGGLFMSTRRQARI